MLGIKPGSFMYKQAPYSLNYFSDLYFLTDAMYVGEGDNLAFTWSKPLTACCVYLTVMEASDYFPDLPVGSHRSHLLWLSATYSSHNLNLELWSGCVWEDFGWRNITEYSISFPGKGFVQFYSHPSHFLRIWLSIASLIFFISVKSPGDGFGSSWYHPRQGYMRNSVLNLTFFAAVHSKDSFHHHSLKFLIF